MKVEATISNISTLFFTYVLSYYSLRENETNFYGVFALFLVGITCLIWSWSTCQVIGLVRVTSLSFLAYQLYEIRNAVPIQPWEVIAFIAMLYLVAYNQYTAQKISSFKTVFLDWFILIPFFPILGFTDLIGRHTHFLLLTSYFVGANIFGIFVIKAAEYFWEEKAQPSSQDSVTFIYLTSMPQSIWKRFHALELITCVSILFYLFSLKVNSVGLGLEDWELYFLFGTFSTIVTYLGPISAGAFLSENDLKSVRDSTN